MKFLLKAILAILFGIGLGLSMMLIGITVTQWEFYAIAIPVCILFGRIIGKF